MNTDKIMKMWAIKMLFVWRWRLGYWDWDCLPPHGELNRSRNNMSEDHDFTPPDANECGGYYCSPEHGHIDCDPIMVARVAILLDLGERFKAGDKTVKPLDKANEHRWNKPQLNYFSGRGEIDCPICKTGKLDIRGLVTTGMCMLGVQASIALHGWSEAAFSHRSTQINTD